MRALSTRWSALAAVLFLALVGASAQAAAAAHAHRGTARAGATSPIATTAAANGAVALTASINDLNLATIASFQYGTTVDYGSTSTSVSVNALLVATTVSVTVTGLTPGATYHYRVVVQNLLGTTYGPDQTFQLAASGVGSVNGGVSVGSTTTVTATGSSSTATTGASTGGASGGGSLTVGVGSTPSGPATGTTGASGATGAGGAGGSTAASGTTGASGSPATGGGASTGGSATGPGTTAGPGSASGSSAAPPQLQRTAVVSDTTGVVLVTPPGATAPVPIGTSLDVPVGSVIDAHAGVVNLTTALDTHGHTQTALLWGGSFRLSYAHGHSGRVILALAGGDFQACGASSSAGTVARAARTAARATRSSHVVRSLWASDNHGRYTTQGNDSVATVQGTVWRTQDRCDGTLTTVARGAVLVTDRVTHRVVRVTAGHSHLAPRDG